MIPVQLFFAASVLVIGTATVDQAADADCGATCHPGAVRAGKELETDDASLLQLRLSSTGPGRDSKSAHPSTAHFWVPSQNRTRNLAARASFYLSNTSAFAALQPRSVFGALQFTSVFGALQFGALRYVSLFKRKKKHAKHISKPTMLAGRREGCAPGVVLAGSREPCAHPFDGVVLTGTSVEEAKPGEVEEEPGDPEMDEQNVAYFFIVPITFSVLISLFIGIGLEKMHISWLPESAMTVVLGSILGFSMKHQLYNYELFVDKQLFTEAVGTLLQLSLLPMLMFEAGWSLRKKDFAAQFPYICMFAILGSLISFCTVGLLMMGTGRMGFHGITSARSAFAYASLVCATDPVATLVTFSHKKVAPLLNILTFGDSVFNDAVAIILFKVLNDNTIMGVPGEPSPSLPRLSVDIVGGVFKIFFGSLAIGLTLAILFLLVLRSIDVTGHPRVVTLALTTMAFLIYACGEIFNMSGIISTIVGAIFLGIYARPHLSEEGSILSNFFFKLVANLMDHLVFLLVGFCLAGMTTPDASTWIFGCWVMLFCLCGRAGCVFPVSALVNFTKRKIGKAYGTPEEHMHLLSPGIIYMMWHAGLRGAIAMTLVLDIGPWAEQLDGRDARHTMRTGTFLMIVVFLFVFGGTTEIALDYWNIPMGDDSPLDALYRTEVPDSIQRHFSSLDKQYLEPLFVGQGETHFQMQKRNADMEVEDVLTGPGALQTFLRETSE